MQFNSDGRIALFIDGANLSASAQALTFEIDYKRLLDLFKEKGRMIRAIYYTAIVEEQERPAIRSLVDWLEYNGYTVVTKPAKKFTDSDGNLTIKGNMDVELAVDAIELCEHLDHIFLFSGDGDFRCLVEALQKRGTAVTVVSTLKNNPPMLADELRRQADNFIELRDIQPKIERSRNLSK